MIIKIKILGINNSFVSVVGAQEFLRNSIGHTQEMMVNIILDWNL
jgi:hypothetical protein